MLHNLKYKLTIQKVGVTKIPPPPPPLEITTFIEQGCTKLRNWTTVTVKYNTHTHTHTQNIGAVI